MTKHRARGNESTIEHAIGADTLDELDQGEHRRRELERGGVANREALLRSLGDTDWRVRRSAARLAGDAAETVNSAELVALLDSEDAGVRNAAMKALIRMGMRALDDLHAALGHEHADVRNFSAVCIGNIGSCASVPTLLETLEDETDENVRYMIVEALGRIGDVRACDALYELLSDREHLAAVAITALADIGSLSSVDHIIPLLSDPYVGGLAAEALCRLADGRALPALVHRAVSADAGSAIFVNAVARTLEQIERRVPDLLRAIRELVSRTERQKLAELLIPGLLSSDIEEARANLRVACWLSDGRLASPVLVAYGHLGMAWCALDIRPDEQFVRQLLEAVKREGTPQGRTAVLETLTEHPQYGMSDLLLDLTNDADPKVVLAALRALIAAEEPVLVRRLMPLWDNPIEDIRHEAARAVGRLCVSGVARIVNDAARCRNEDRVRCAATALASFRRPIRGAILQGTMNLLARHPDPSVRADIARAAALKTAGRASHELLLEFTRDKSPLVRRAAANGMRGSERNEDRERLHALMTDPDPSVRRTAVSGLGGLHAGRREADIITSAIEDPDPRVSIAAIEAVGTCQRLLSAPGVLLEYAHAEDVDVAVEAIRSLSRLDPLLAATTAKAMWDTSAPWRLRAALVQALSGASVEHALACASSVLDDADPAVRVVAVDILAAQRDTDGAMLLLTLLADDDLRAAANEVLLEYGSVAAGPLTQVSKAAGGLSCIDAARLLGHMPGHEAKEAIQSLLDDSEAEIRWRGLAALACRSTHGFESELARIADSDSEAACASLARVILHSTQEPMS